MYDQTAPQKPFARWLRGEGPLGDPHTPQDTHRWYLVLWLTGVDYFSTLGYQPSIALLAAGPLAPLSTAILVLFTLLGALPVYSQVASRSYAGQGSIAMLEHLVPGWAGKLFVLVLLGFAGTDFIITITLSAADAAQHAVENPYLHPYIGEHRMYLTLTLLALLAAVFLKGFHEAIDFAVAVTVPYLLLNLIVILRGMNEIARHPQLIHTWKTGLMRGDWTMLLIASALFFPRLALGMSGFETGVSVMPLIAGTSIRERVHATRLLLSSAAGIMSVYLILSSVVTTFLIPSEAVGPGGPAYGRALAYIAHQYLGNGFGTFYDMATLTVLWFAGASAMAGLISLLPRYLPRFGMAPQWVSYRRPLVILLFMITVAITFIFHADVQAQSGAYATGVLMLMLSAGVAVALALWRESRRALSIYFGTVSAIFAFALIDNIIARPDGVIIASAFILIMIVVSAISRYARTARLKVFDVTFADDNTGHLWAGMIGKKVHSAPLRINSPQARERRAREISKRYALRGPLAFIHVKLLDNRSELVLPYQIRVWREREDYVVEVRGAIAVANTIAHISDLIDPISIVLRSSRQTFSSRLRFFVLGDGATGLLVQAILVKYWGTTRDERARPLIVLMSDS